MEVFSSAYKTSSRQSFGNEHYMAAVYEQNAEVLYRYGMKFTSRESIVEDSIQDIFIELYSNNYDMSGVENVRYFLFTCFKRKLLKNLSKDQRFIYGKESSDYSFEVLYSLEHEIILKESSEKKNRLLLQALEKLTSRQTEAIYLKFTSGFTYPEISELLGMSVEACRNLMYRSVKSLKNTVRENMGKTQLLRKTVG
jgi:RNA polymerase sigma factor (sigma-70 family)